MPDNHFYKNPPLWKESDHRIKIVRNFSDFLTCIAFVFVALACTVYGLSMMAIEKMGFYRLHRFIDRFMSFVLIRL